MLCRGAGEVAKAHLEWGGTALRRAAENLLARVLVGWSRSSDAVCFSLLVELSTFLLC